MVGVKGVGQVRTCTKTDASEREVHGLPDGVVAMLRELLDELPAGTEDSMAPVLPSWKGAYLVACHVRRAWRDARALSLDVDLSWVTPHTLRKTAGTSIAEVAGVLAASTFLGPLQHARLRAALHGPTNGAGQPRRGARRARGRLVIRMSGGRVLG